MNATEYCKLVENKLGWMPPQGPAFRRYQAEAAKVKRKIATAPDYYTWEALQLAVELLWRERLPRSPLGVFAHVERALAMAVETESDIEVEIRKAMAYEERRGDPAGWVVRFSRADGPYRREALEEWRESVR